MPPMGFKLKVPRLDKVAAKYLRKAGHTAATPLKFVGGTAARALGSDATFAQFDAGLDRIMRGKVKRDDVNRAFHAGGTFLAAAPAALVDNTGDLVRNVAKEATEDAGGLLKDGLTGLFSGGGLPLLILLAVAAYVLFGTSVGKRIIG